MSGSMITRGQSFELATVGEAANEAAARNVFADYRSRKARNTLKGQAVTLAAFAEFLRRTGANVGELGTDPEAWRGISWGLVEQFRNWLVMEGYSIGTVNVRLSTVKTYAKLAAKAGAISKEGWAMISLVEGYGHKDGKRLDEHRKAGGLETRVSPKKADATRLYEAHVHALRSQPETPQGRRDRVMLALMLDLGLRVGELAGLVVDDVDLERGEITFYRSKVDKTQRHTLAVNGCLKAVRAYMEQDAPSEGRLLRASRHNGTLAGAGMTSRAITARVRKLGKELGLQSLSAHDLRHSWKDRAKEGKTQDTDLQEAGGWASLAMVQRYGHPSKIANEGIKLAY